MTKIKLQETSKMLVLVLALIAGIVAVGLIEGYKMYAFIVMYWLVLTMKNLIDYFGNQKEEPTHDEHGQ